MMIETQTRQFVTPERPGTSESNCASRSNRNREGWCPHCAAAVVMVSQENGIGVAGISARAIYWLVESGMVHFAKTPEGVLLICLSSLADYETTDTLDIELKTLPRSEARKRPEIK